MFLSFCWLRTLERLLVLPDHFNATFKVSIEVVSTWRGRVFLCSLFLRPPGSSFEIWRFCFFLAVAFVDGYGRSSTFSHQEAGIVLSVSHRGRFCTVSTFRWRLPMFQLTSVARRHYCQPKSGASPLFSVCWRWLNVVCLLKFPFRRIFSNPSWACGGGVY